MIEYRCATKVIRLAASILLYSHQNMFSTEELTILLLNKGEVAVLQIPILLKPFSISNGIQGMPPR
jgi:hypothetical protein